LIKVIERLRNWWMCRNYVRLLLSNVESNLDPSQVRGVTPAVQQVSDLKITSLLPENPILSFDLNAICRGIYLGHVVFFHSDGKAGDFLYECELVDVPHKVRQLYTMLHHLDTRNNLFRCQYANGSSVLAIRGIAKTASGGSIGTNSWLSFSEITQAKVVCDLFQNCAGVKEILMRLAKECIVGAAIPVLANYVAFDEQTDCHCLFIIRNENYGEMN
jgi:hypothetical protein